MLCYRVKEGTVCHLSELGHYNFYYPSDIKIWTTIDVEVSKLTWISYGELIPIKIPSDALCDNKFCEGKKYTAVWVNKVDLLRDSS